jgi:hypothetical protein
MIYYESGSVRETPWSRRTKNNVPLAVLRVFVTLSRASAATEKGTDATKPSKRTRPRRTTEDIARDDESADAKSKINQRRLRRQSHNKLYTKYNNNKKKKKTKKKNTLCRSPRVITTGRQQQQHILS